MNDQVLLAKLILGLLGVVATGFLGGRQWIFSLPWRNFTVGSQVALVVSRLGLFTLVFIVMGVPAQSDVAGYYYPAVKGAMAGGWPYRDYFTTYAPLFTTVAMPAVWLWDSPKSMVLLAIIFEVAAFPLWLELGRRHLDERQTRQAAVFYLTSPLPLVNVALDGQNQVWIALLMAGALALLLMRRSFASGMVFGASLAMVKILPLLFAPALGWYAWRRGRWVLGCILLPGVVYGVLLMKGINPLEPLRFEGQDTTSGNLPYFLGTILDVNLPTRWLDLGTLIALGVSFVSIVAGRRDSRGAVQQVIPLVVFTLLVLLIFSKKSYSNYLVMIFFPLCLVAVGKHGENSGWGPFGWLGAVALLEPSIWFRWVGKVDSVTAHSVFYAPGRQTNFLLFLTCEILLILLYAMYAFKAWKQARSSGNYEH